VQVHASFDHVARLANDARTARAGWDALIDYLARRVDHRVLAPLKSVDIDKDVDAVRTQLVALLASEPPRVRLGAVYFALVDDIDENERPCIGCYVAGFDRVDPDDPDGFSVPIWSPERSRLRSIALRGVKKAELAARSLDSMTLLGYTAPLGAGLIVSRFASRGLFPECQRVVGLDSGGMAEITAD
jgi:hypothetical protein